MKANEFLQSSVFKGDKIKQHFICASEKYSQMYDHLPAPYIRKDFVITDHKNAALSICGIGFYELFINGQKITKGKLAPYISNPDHLIYYDEYDVSDLLKQGGNTVGVILGNGFLNNAGGFPWGFDKAPFRSAPMLSLILEIDGKEILCSDESFKTAPSPIYFDDFRCGEYYDARNEQDGWASYGFDDCEWSFCKKAQAPKGRAVLCDAEPIKVTEEILPVSKEPVDGGYVFDFGINTAGVCRIELEGTKGQRITLQHGEALVEGHSVYFKNICTPDFDRSMAQKDIFICSGKKDVFEPCFTYHGFRYVFVEGLTCSQFKNLSIKLLKMHSDVKKVGEFSCSNEMLNKLQSITLNSDLSNFFYFPTDCPQREKNGWTGDAALSCEQMLYNFDFSNSLETWLDNIRCAQCENGQLPGVVPTVKFGYGWGNGPAWDLVLTELTYQIYRFTGNERVLEDNAEAIARYIAFLKTKLNKNDLISFGLPDWCECGALIESDVSTPLEVTDTLVSIDICQKAEKIFAKIGKTADAQTARIFAHQLKERFREVWLDKDCFVKCNTQTAQAKAIDAGIFTSEEKPKAVENLVSIIHNQGEYFHVGMIGSRVLFRVLADNGYGNLALKMMTRDGFPSYKYWLDLGATSLWESFNEVREGSSIFRKDGGRVLSLNHHFWGDISAWFYRYVLGININPSFEKCNEFELSPIMLDGVDVASGSYIRNGNGIEVNATRKYGKIFLKVTTFGNAVWKISDACPSNVIVEN